MGQWRQLVFLSHTDWVWNGSSYVQVNTREWKLLVHLVYLSIVCIDFTLCSCPFLYGSFNLVLLLSYFILFFVYLVCILFYLHVI